MMANLLKRVCDADASGDELRQLMIKIRAAKKLAGRDNHKNDCLKSATQSPKFFCETNQAATRSRLALRSRLLFAPTICSATCPLLISNKVGMARMPYWVASACCS